MRVVWLAMVVMTLVACAGPRAASGERCLLTSPRTHRLPERVPVVDASYASREDAWAAIRADVTRVEQIMQIARETRPDGMHDYAGDQARLSTLRARICAAARSLDDPDAMTECTRTAIIAETYLTDCWPGPDGALALACPFAP